MPPASRSAGVWPVRLPHTSANKLRQAGSAAGLRRGAFEREKGAFHAGGSRDTVSGEKRIAFAFPEEVRTIERENQGGWPINTFENR